MEDEKGRRLLGLQTGLNCPDLCNLADVVVAVKGQRERIKGRTAGSKNQSSGSGMKEGEEKED